LPDRSLPPAKTRLIRQEVPVKLRDKFIVHPGETVRLEEHDPDQTLGFDKQTTGKEATETSILRLDELQYVLYAENQRALLIILQAMDAGGKDGTIRHVMSGTNPQSCKVTSFKVPSAEEAAHDFLWRVHRAVPGKGEIGIFNRSHYEDVLVLRVHKLLPREVWSARYQQINTFEKLLSENGVTLVKFFLHISKDEQKKRLQARIDDPKKRWKISPADLAERKYWDEYQKAFEDALSQCSTHYAPWFVIPANKKWFRDLAVSGIIVETLEQMNPKFPKPAFDVSKLTVT
jgi:PPK2 family polyphosphate:nucleotide phosphotransferase